MDLEQNLLNLKNEISEAEVDKNKWLGRIEDLEKKFKKRGFKSISEAKKKVANLNKEIATLEKEIERKINSIKIKMKEAQND